MNQSHEPRWWPLLLVSPVVLALLVLESRLAVASPWHQFLQMGIVLSVGIFVIRWVERGTLRCCEDQK